MWQLVANCIVSAAQLALFGSGLYLAHRVRPALSFASLVPFTLAPYAALLVVDGLVVSLGLALALGLLVASGSMLGWERYVNGTLENRQAPASAHLLVSFGAMVVLVNSVAMVFGDEARLLGSESVSPGLQFGGARLTVVQLATSLASAGVSIAIILAVRFTDFGLQFRGLSCNPALARATGIPVTVVRGTTWALAGAVMGLAGLFAGLDTALTPSFGLPVLFMGVIAFVVGGRGGYGGLLLSSILIGTLQQVAVFVLASRWHEPLLYAVFIGVVAVTPRGLVSETGDRYEREAP